MTRFGTGTGRWVFRGSDAWFVRRSVAGRRRRLGAGCGRGAGLGRRFLGRRPTRMNRRVLRRSSRRAGCGTFQVSFQVGRRLLRQRIVVVVPSILLDQSAVVCRVCGFQCRSLLVLEWERGSKDAERVKRQPQAPKKGWVIFSVGGRVGGMENERRCAFGGVQRRQQQDRTEEAGAKQEQRGSVAGSKKESHRGGLHGGRKQVGKHTLRGQLAWKGTLPRLVKNIWTLHMARRDERPSSRAWKARPQSRRGISVGKDQHKSSLQ